MCSKFAANIPESVCYWETAEEALNAAAAIGSERIQLLKVIKVPVRCSGVTGFTGFPQPRGSFAEIPQPGMMERNPLKRF